MVFSPLLSGTGRDFPGEQIRGLNKSIAELDRTFGEESSRLEGHQGLTSIKAIGKITRGRFCHPASRIDPVHRREVAFDQHLPGPGVGTETSSRCKGAP